MEMCIFDIIKFAQFVEDIDKEKELFEGIGEKGVALIPQYLQGTIKKNLAYYLKKAGIIDNAPTTQS